MNIEKQKNFLTKFAFTAIVLGIAYIAVKYLVPALLPFVLGMVIAVIFKGPVAKTSKRTGIHRALVSVVFLAIFYVVFAILILLLGSQLFSLVEDGIALIPGFYKSTIEPFIIRVVDGVIEKIPQADSYTIELGDVINNVISSLSSFVTRVTSTAISAIATIATKLPVLLVNSIFTIVSSFFFTIDYHVITDFIFRQLPEDKAIRARSLKSDLIGTIWKYIKSYSVLMLLTFSELTIGMLLLGIPNPLAVAAIISVIDILPVLGTGTVLIPWAILGFIFKDYKIAFGMLLMYVIITAVRQTLEPKIIGKQIGLHPVITLISIFVGAKLFGLIGIFLLPITITMIKQMNDEGAIHWFK